MKVSLEDLQKALINESITIDQFIEVLIDNFGPRKTRQILRKNLALALNQEATDHFKLSSSYPQLISSTLS